MPTESKIIKDAQSVSFSKGLDIRVSASKGSVLEHRYDGYNGVSWTALGVHRQTIEASFVETFSSKNAAKSFLEDLDSYFQQLVEIQNSYQQLSNCLLVEIRTQGIRPLANPECYVSGSLVFWKSA